MSGRGKAPTMVMRRPNPGLANNQYVTTCKLCGRGVYQGQDYAWLDKPMGISHVDCAERGSS